MFTEGLDDNAINWVKQGSEVQQRQQVRSPLAERVVRDGAVESPLYSTRSFLQSPKVLPTPSLFHSGLLPGVSALTMVGAGLDEEEGGESVASVDMDLGFSDLEEEEEEEVEMGVSDADDLCDEASFLRLYNDGRRGLVRGSSKENLMIEVPAVVARKMPDMVPAQSCKFFTPQGRFTDERRTPNQMDMGTPSAPPIGDIGRHSLETEGEQWRGEAQECKDQTISAPTMQHSRSPRGSSGVEEERESLGTSVEVDVHSQKMNQMSSRSATTDQHVPKLHVNSLDQPSYFYTSGQSAWQTLIAYDACFRLCLNAWARECLEAPDFLRDECMLLRNAFGLQKYLLQPRSQLNTKEEVTFHKVDDGCSKKARKVTSKVKVEVRKTCIIPRRKLYTTFSQRGSLYMQAGAQYVRHISTMLKRRMVSLKLPSIALTSEESQACMVQLKSSTDEMQMDSEAAICLKAGSGDSHIFYPESQGDALLFEVKDNNRVTQGRAIIKLSSLTDNPSDKVRWWPIYHEDQECVGKIQLSIITVTTSDDTAAIKSGTVVETLAYDLVLEAALRSEQFHSRNLRLYGPWKWLLTEFADYYGVTDAYTKLRYLSYVMAVATPTKDCLELVHELLVLVIKARVQKNLTRQERSILLDCETQVEKLLATVFENYKSLDEDSPTGLTDTFGPVPESAAPALVPSVHVFTLLHDILSQEAQETLQNYLKTAAEKRCRRHMVETDDFLSSNNEGLAIDEMTVSTSYLKMKTLCINISNEIQADRKIHDQHILPSSIDLPNIATGVYSTELCNRLRCFLSACPPSSPLPYVTELLVTTDDFERNLQSWNIRPVIGGVDSKNLFNHYIMVWIEDKRLSFLELCKADKAPWSGITTHHSTSPFVEDMYDRMRDMLNEYEIVVNRWLQYALVLENAIASVERAVVKTMEKQFSEILAPLKDSIPKKLGIQVQKLTRRQLPSPYNVPTELGIFLGTVKRILDVLHCRLEDILKPWASCLPVIGDRKSVFGEQLNEVTVMLRTKYKNYMQATVEKLVSNAQTNRNTRLKRILEETKEEDGQMQVRDRMQVLCSQLIDTIQNLHYVFSSRIFIAICRGFWERMGQIVLSFLESKKENRVWFKGSYYALGVLDDMFASQMQRFQGNALQEKDLDPPRSVVEARSILCRDSPNTTDQSTYFNY